MDDDTDALIKSQLANTIPKSVKIICAAFLTFGLTMNWLGLNFAGPLQVIAIAYAESYKAQLERDQHRDDMLAEIIERLERVEKLAHEPGKLK